MAMPIENIEALLEKLELDAPDVYIRCIASLPDKKGNVREKKCILNLKTGDVLPKRKIESKESVNFRIVRSYGDRRKGTADVIHYAFQNAQIIDDEIVLTTWIFGDHINYPETNNVGACYYGDPLVDKAKKGTVKSPDALMNIVLSEPKIAAVVTVSENKEVRTWEDIAKYGFKHKYGADSGDYLAHSLVNTLFHTYDTKRVCDLTKCFKKFFEIGYAGANKYLSFDSYKDVAAFMRASPMKMKNNGAQKRIDELTSIQLPDHTAAKMIEKTICYADRVDDEWTVLRWWLKSQSTKYVETARMYVNKTEALHCRSDLNGNWIASTVKLKAETFKADRVVLQSDDVLDGTKLEYFKNISTELSNQSAALYMLTMYPEFEKMYKIGLCWLCDNYIKAPYQCSWKSYLEDRVSYVDWDAKNIFKMVGLNRHQVESIAAFKKRMSKDAPDGTWPAYYVNGIIAKMKKIFGVYSLNSIDNETFNYILESINIDRLVSVYINALTLTFSMYPRDAMYFIKDLNAISEGGTRFLEYRTQHGHTARLNVDRLYFDTIQMIRNGEYMDVIRPRFSSVDELLNHHQVMVDLVNANKMEEEARVNKRYESGFQTNHERWKKWEWEGDEVFCVIAPEKPIDVAAEGIALRHCVKSYIPSVSQGTTNIMFIRRKGKETEPFFTIEVDDRNNVRQVHGMCNCNVSSVEGLREFVKKWSKMKKLRYNESNANRALIAR